MCTIVVIYIVFYINASHVCVYDRGSLKLNYAIFTIRLTRVLYIDYTIYLSLLNLNTAILVHKSFINKFYLFLIIFNVHFVFITRNIVNVWIVFLNLLCHLIVTSCFLCFDL